MIFPGQEDNLCSHCNHPGFEHGLWMGVDRLREVEKTRVVGCRVVGCECSGWATIVGSFYQYIE